MKKILHITMSNAYGGAETVIFSIVDNLKDKYEFVYMCPKGNIEESLKLKGITYKTFNSVKDIFQIAKNINEINSDIIHAHDFMASVICALVSRGRILISHLHTSHNWIRSCNIKSVIYYLAAFKFKDIIVVSNSMKKEMYFYNNLKNKIKVLINPLDTKQILKLSEKYECTRGYDLGFVGRLSDYKDPIRFIDIVGEIKKERKNVQAIIIGEGELRKQCEEKIEELHLKDNIKMEGFLQNPFPIVKKIKILVLPSKVEALGLAALEGMLLGRVVVASDVGGFRDFINECNGVLCKNKQEFTLNIENILGDEELYSKLSENAIKTSEFMGNIEKYMKEISKVYEGKEVMINNENTLSVSYNGDL